MYDGQYLLYPHLYRYTKHFSWPFIDVCLTKGPKGITHVDKKNLRHHLDIVDFNCRLLFEMIYCTLKQHEDISFVSVFYNHNEFQECLSIRKNVLIAKKPKQNEVWNRHNKGKLMTGKSVFYPDTLKHPLSGETRNVVVKSGIECHGK